MADGMQKYNCLDIRTFEMFFFCLFNSMVILVLFFIAYLQRMDEDQCTRRNAQFIINRRDPDYYEFEGKIFIPILCPTHPNPLTNDCGIHIHTKCTYVRACIDTHEQSQTRKILCRLYKFDWHIFIYLSVCLSVKCWCVLPLVCLSVCLPVRL